MLLLLLLFYKFAHSVCLCHVLLTHSVSVSHFGNFHNISKFSLSVYFYGALWSMIFDVYIVIIWGHHEPHLDKISSVQFLSRVQLFVTPWTAARQASLSITNSWSSLKLMSTELVMPSNHLILCSPLLPPSIFPNIRVFSVSQLFPSGGQSIGVSASLIQSLIK